ncbi:hypothetical protein L1887_35218 [Cichorium endivia]|nr:hypothetical protein L1887_35218 [Cichorium endivia]
MSTKCLLAPFQSNLTNDCDRVSNSFLTFYPTKSQHEPTTTGANPCQKVFWGFKNNLKNSSIFLPPHKKNFQHSQFCP